VATSTSDSAQLNHWDERGASVIIWLKRLELYKQQQQQQQSSDSVQRQQQQHFDRMVEPADSTFCVGRIGRGGNASIELSIIWYWYQVPMRRSCRIGEVLKVCCLISLWTVLLTLWIVIIASLQPSSSESHEKADMTT
jgi:hypothetical protein